MAQRARVLYDFAGEGANCELSVFENDAVTIVCEVSLPGCNLACGQESTWHVWLEIDRERNPLPGPENMSDRFFYFSLKHYSKI